MSELDVAKLKRIRGAVDSTLVHAEATLAGLSETYNALRSQAREAVPEGLRAELDVIAPAISRSNGMAALKEAHLAHAHLAAISGWLSSVIDTQGGNANGR